MSDDSQPIDAMTAFLVVMNSDGGIDVFTSSLPSVNVQRVADVSDIEAASLRLGAEAGRWLMVNSLTQKDEDPSPGHKVAQALSQRIGS